LVCQADWQRDPGEADVRTLSRHRWCAAVVPGHTRSQHRCRHPPAARRCQLPGTGARSVPRSWHRCRFPWHGTNS